MIQRCAQKRHFCKLFTVYPKLYTLNAFLAGQCPGDGFKDLAFIGCLVVVKRRVKFNHCQFVFVH
ncbi:hypothetical protein D3C81_1468550 [compost metagenome]